MASEKVWSVGAGNCSYFLNKSGHRYTLTRVSFPSKLCIKVAVNKTILNELKKMGRWQAMGYCKKLIKTRKRIPMGDREYVKKSKKKNSRYSAASPS